jgi:hypothetical protein
MRAQGYTEEEIADMLKCDKEIDRGADPFPLDPELEAGAKKARRADRTDTPKKANRERKIDNEKRELIACFTESLADLRCCEGFDITELQVANPEREFSFMMNGRKFKVTLSCPRS